MHFFKGYDGKAGMKKVVEDYLLTGTIDDAAMRSAWPDINDAQMAKYNLINKIKEKVTKAVNERQILIPDKEVWPKPRIPQKVSR